MEVRMALSSNDCFKRDVSEPSLLKYSKYGRMKTRIFDLLTLNAPAWALKGGVCAYEMSWPK